MDGWHTTMVGDQEARTRIMLLEARMARLEGPRITLAEVRGRYSVLVRQLFDNQAAYAERKEDIRRQYGSEQHERGDVILSDLSSGARTLSAMISALADVLRAELEWAQYHARTSPREEPS